MPVIAHISDLHLQSTVPARQEQVEPILRAINAAKPDLVVISGDVTDDGWDSIDELKWAKDWLGERIEGDWFAVPGNHDVGNFSNAREGVVNADRIAVWRDVFRTRFEDIFWHEKIGEPWVILGLNSMSFATGTLMEYEQWVYAHERTRRTDWTDRHLAVFLHAPLFINHPDEPANQSASYWLGPDIERRGLWEDIQLPALKLIASGHVHQTRLAEVEGVKIAWAPPASGTWVHAPGLPNPPMPKQTGFFLHTLHDDGRVESELVECAPMLKLYEHNPRP